MRRILLLIFVFVLIKFNCLGQRTIDTLSNGYYEIVIEEKGKIRRTLFNKQGQLLRIAYGHSNQNPKSELCCSYTYTKVEKFDRQGKKLKCFTDTIYNTFTGKVVKYGSYYKNKKDGEWTLFNSMGNVFEKVLYDKGRFIRSLESYHYNGIKSREQKLINVCDSNIKWYVFKNDSIFLEPIKNTYPFDKIIIEKKWGYNGVLNNIEYYIYKDRSSNVLKYLKFHDTGTLSSYYAAEIKKNHGFNNSILITGDQEGSLKEYCRRDKNMNCIEIRKLNTSAPRSSEYHQPPH